MGYYVRRLKGKKNKPDWKVQYVSYKQKDQRKNSTAKVPKRTWDIAKERWTTLGFHSGLDLRDAKVRARQLNSQLSIKRQEERLRAIAEEQKIFQLHHEAVLPSEFVSEFESRFIEPRGILSALERRRQEHRRYNIWHAAQKMITAVGVEPTDWFYHVYEIYDFFSNSGFSIGYLQSIIKLANLWGHFISRKLAKPFHPIPYPKGYERRRLLEAHYQTKSRKKLPSLPISPVHLNDIKEKLSCENFNWLYLSIWFGLRPKETDSLKDKNMWKLEELPTGRKILWVFQTKIIALPPDDRWKPFLRGAWRSREHCWICCTLF